MSVATFQYYYYDSTYDDDNPMNLAITEHKMVTAYYTMEIIYQQRQPENEKLYFSLFCFNITENQRKCTRNDGTAK
jgi:hypothetical protein